MYIYSVYIYIYIKELMYKELHWGPSVHKPKGLSGDKDAMASHDLLSLIVNTTCFGTWISAVFFIGSVFHYLHRTKRRFNLSTFGVQILILQPSRIH